MSIPESDPRACSRGARVNALARVPFFAGLDLDALHQVDARANMHGMEADEAVYLARHRAEHLYVVATGVVKLTGTSPDGTVVLLDVLGPGGFFGTLPALGGVTYAEDAWALTSGCLLSFTSDRFEAVLSGQPSVARAALVAIGQRLRVTQDRIERMASASAPARIASTLLTLAGRLGVDDGERVLIDVPLTREDLASLSGCAPETVSRSLAAWSRDGVVETGRRWVSLRRPEVLADLAGVPGAAGPDRRSCASADHDGPRGSRVPV
ncbi:cAMP-binding protein [Egicoccus halophilus]|uniref:cAMP-binding protein n=1 Tax=Egicoccus halophilus TaxID=1670830 RepID=A0A8J3A5E5_9ACTN|nr:cAMP-binding protein [Egicoccus halophilus]